MHRKSLAAGRCAVVGVLAGLCSVAVPAQGGQGAAAGCAGLTNLRLTGVTITAATIVGAGQMPAPPARGGNPPASPSPFAGLPEVCRVAATLRPSPDSEIRMELWM